MSDGPRIVTLDIERSPILVNSWGLFNQNHSIEMIDDPSRTICFAAKTLGSPHVTFADEWADTPEGMLETAWEVIDEADIIVSYNGTAFDLPNLRREFLLAGMPPPSPVAEIDLYRVVKKHFKFDSHKLDWVARQLGIGGKRKHAGFDLWRRCMAGDDAAWNEMRKYNVQDVKLTEKLYLKLLPWISNHPHVGLFNGEEWSCNKCGGTDLIRKGYKYTPTGKYQQLKCRKCGGWSAKTTRDFGTTVKGVA